MMFQIQLFRGPDREYFGAVPFLDVVRLSLEGLLGWDLSDKFIFVTVLNVPDDSAQSGTPIVENVIPEFGYTQVRISQGGVVVYQHPHPVSDLITHTLQGVLREGFPDEAIWGFRLDVPGMPLRSTSRPAPLVEGAVMVGGGTHETQPAFTIRRLPEPDPPVKSLREFGVAEGDSAQGAQVKVVLPRSLAVDLQRRRLSDEFEEGGFLIGQVFKDGETEGAFIVEVKDAVAAEFTGASFLHFTFTGDSFASIRQGLHQNHSGDRLLGWFHTHLFPATDDFGLSPVDWRLHFSTFTIPWQVAGLLNLDGANRVLRFYVRQGDDMVLCPYWVTE